MDERTIEQIKEDNVTRLRRSEAWIEKANLAKDATSKFIFYWIAFNAQYSKSNAPEEEKRNKFLDEICKDKNGKRELEFIFNKNKVAIERIFELPQTHLDFWKNPKKLGEQQIENMEQWQLHFEKNGSLPEDNKEKLEKLFSRLSVVRNQIFHGSHSGNKDGYDSSIQVEKGTEVLSSFIPCFLDIIQSSIKDNSCTGLWGELSHRGQSKPGNVNCPPPWLLEGKK